MTDLKRPARALFHLATLIQMLLLPALLLAVASAGYTAFLFGQAEGRDFWQSPLFLPILLVQAVLAGAASRGKHGTYVSISFFLSRCKNVTDTPSKNGAGLMRPFQVTLGVMFTLLRSIIPGVNIC